MPYNYQLNTVRSSDPLLPRTRLHGVTFQKTEIFIYNTFENLQSQMYLR